MVEYFWCRVPGSFVDETTGTPVSGTFAGTARDWFQTLALTVSDMAQAVSDSGVEFDDQYRIVTSENVGSVLQSSALFKPVTVTSEQVHARGAYIGRLYVCNFPVYVGRGLTDEVHLVKVPLNWSGSLEDVGRVTVLSGSF